MRFDVENPMMTRYEILEQLGEGGMGVVYKARDTRLDRYVALKYMAASLTDSQPARTRSAQEARAIAALNHPHIATIYEINEIDGAPVLILEYLPGGTLRRRLAERPLSFAEIVEFGLQVAAGLAHAHAHGLVHGDVKPENLLFTEQGGLKITDFGLARIHDEHADRTVTVDGKISGTLMYMAPECLQGWPADCLSDIFSLGVMLEEMAAGQPMPESFRTVVARATARDRSQRFQSMHAVADSLRRLRETPEAGASDTATVLVIEDDDGLRSALELGLSSEGYRVLKAGNGREGMRIAAQQRPDLVLLDVTLPGLNGFDVCRELRRTGFEAPIMMVTGRTEETDRVVGLEIGADDYLTKPFGHRELIARVRVRLRRGYGSGKKPSVSRLSQLCLAS
jgi:serine/threonine protein kinase